MRPGLSSRPLDVAALRERLARLERTQHRLAEWLPTGFARLDDALGGGLPFGALVELLVAEPGSGALEAFLPAFVRDRPTRLFAWVDRVPPFPPALAQIGFDLERVLLVRPRDLREQAWALDLALRSRACEAVVASLARLDDASLRRLQLAAESSGTLALLVRPLALADLPSPAATRLEVAPLRSSDPRRRRLRVVIRRCRAHGRHDLDGARAGDPIDLEWSRDPLDEFDLPTLRARAEAARERDVLEVRRAELA
jgi:hypothetical protein